MVVRLKPIEPAVARTLPVSPERRSNTRDEQLAAAVAQTILDGIRRHYSRFRYHAQLGKARFEAGDYHAIRRLASERIAFYDQRVREAVGRLASEFNAQALSDPIWQRVKRHYVGLLERSMQPALAETFFNSVCCQILHRTYFNNDFIFVRPAVATAYLDAAPPSYRSYYPTRDDWPVTLRTVVSDFGLACPWQDIDRDIAYVMAAARAWAGDEFRMAADCQIQVLGNLFYRNKAAYLIGRVINDGEIMPFAVPILRNAGGQLTLDAGLFGSERIEALFNFSRAYFMVDMEVPSAYVQFLRTLIPNKPESELYTMLGLQKQGKTLFYRDLLHHLSHSHDQFTIAPGIKGMVMGVFTLPSFPYVFKVIKDVRGKDVSREFIKKQYQLVKFHDRVGRMADTWEYSDVSFPRARMAPELIDELYRTAPSLLEDDGANIVVRHLYIERRMTPLNLYLEQATDPERRHAMREYGQAIKDMIAANIFPGDMLYKNFGMTRQGRVVFYDYDEVAYLTDCNFRRVPPPRTPEDEMASEPWYTVAPNDVFPEEFATFLLGEPEIRQAFLAWHADLLGPEYWQDKQRRIRSGELVDVFPYPEELRFSAAPAPAAPVERSGSGGQ